MRWFVEKHSYRYIVSLTAVLMFGWVVLLSAGTHAAGTAPTISGVAPASAANSGGDSVTVTGANFDSGASVWFGTAQSASTTFVNDTTLTATVPPYVTIGAVTVKVVNSDAMQGTLASGFRYLIPAPVVNTVTPSSGTSLGGTSAVLNGSGFNPLLSNVTAIASNAHSCAISGGELYCWGNNDNGQVGNGSVISPVLYPYKVQGGLVGKTVTAVSTGANHTCAIANSALYCWGRNDWGQVGPGNASTPQTTPQAVVSPIAGKTITGVTAGTYDTCAIGNSALYCWGRNVEGQLGIGTTDASTHSTPAAVGSPVSGKTVTAITGSSNHFCTVANGVLYCWGLNTYGQIGNGVPSSYESAPTAVKAPVSGKTIGLISAGGSHACALADNQMYCWGLNTSGQVGTGNTTSPQVNPTLVVSPISGQTPSATAVNGTSTCAFVGGVMYCWGENTYGQVGTGNTTTPQLTPAAVISPVSGQTVTNMSLGGANTCAAVGVLYCWGRNESGQVGTGNLTTPQLTPIGVRYLLPFAVSFGGTNATVTDRSSSAITVTTPVHAAGLVDIGLTDPNTLPLTLTNAYTYIAPPQITAVTPNSGLTSGGDTVTITGQDFNASSTVKFGTTDATSVTFVNSSTLSAVIPAAVSIGVVNVTVTNPDSQTSTLTSGFTYTAPAPVISTVMPNAGTVAGGTNVTIDGTGFAAPYTSPTATSAGVRHSCSVVSGGVYCWGRNASGQIGQGVAGTPTMYATPQKVQGALAGLTATGVASGTDHSCAIAAGELYCWGDNTYGQIGNASSGGNVLIPTKVQGTLAGKTVTSVDADQHSTCVVASAEVYCWGRNIYGAVGNGTYGASNVTSPFRVQGTIAGKTMTLVSTSGWHTCARATDGLYCWGLNYDGQIGNNGTIGSLTPVTTIYKTITSANITSVSLGLSHSCAVDGGALYCWGDNSVGQIGRGNTTDSKIPVLTTGILNAVTVSSVNAGQEFTCAVAGGEAYCWGKNNSSQVGIGNNATPQNTPVKVTQGLIAGKTVTDISAGENFACALTNKGQYCWGDGGDGQIGNGLTSTAATSLGVTGFSLVPYALAVTVGGNAVTPTYVDDTKISLTTPVHAAGAVDVVLTATNVATATASSAYTYNAVPTVSSVTPGTGAATGGDTVTISGTNFIVTPTVKFGDATASSVTWINSSTLTVTVPASLSAGAVDVRVTNSDGQAATKSAGFTYTLAAPAISTVVPDHGSTLGGDGVVLNGGGFAAISKSVTAEPRTVGGFSCVISGGDLYCWGTNGNGQAGTGNITSPVTTPTKVAGLPSPVTAAAGGSSHMCAVAAGELYCWGEASVGKIGNGSTSGNVLTPYKVQGVMAGLTVTDVIAGQSNTCAIANNELYCWGSNSNGQIGNGASGTNVTTPYKVQGLLAGKTIASVALGNNSTCATANGEVYCWGDGSTSGQLGGGSFANSLTPVKVQGALAGKVVTSVAAGFYHFCALANSEVYCWGDNSYGQSGVGSITVTSQLSPVKVQGTLAGKTVDSIASGARFMCALAVGEQYCWGYNQVGQIGNGSSGGNVTSPYKVQGNLAAKTVTKIGALGEAACGLANGEQYCWGDNTNYQIGDNTNTTPRTLPTATAAFSNSAIAFTATFGGSAATVGAATSSTLALTSPAHVAGLVDIILTATNVGTATATNSFTYISPPSIGTISPNTGLITGGDTITITGSNFRTNPTVRFGGRTAAATYVNSSTITVTVPVSLASGATNVYVVNDDNQMATSTNGFTYTNPAPTITSVAPSGGSTAGGTNVALSGSGFVTRQGYASTLTSGYNFACAINEGELSCWGNNTYGQIGTGNTTTPQLTPVKVQGLLAGKTVTQVSAGGYDVCAIAGGELYCWGYNIYGQTGDGTTTSPRLTPYKVQDSLAGKTVTAVSASDNHTCAVADGTMYCWGYNSSGQSGTGNTTSPQLTPVAVIAPISGKTITAIAAGNSHTCAVANGALYCWGANNSGQVGIGNTTSPQLTPVAVIAPISGKTITALSASPSGSHSCAVASGALYCWGYGGFGQLGDGNFQTRSTPVAVIDPVAGKTITSVSAGYDHSCAVANNGTYCFGYNGNGANGNGLTTGNQLTPYKVQGLLAGLSIASVSTGGSLSCSLATGSVYCWGANASGQTGKGSTSTQELSPLAVPFFASVANTFTASFGGTAATIVSTLSTAVNVTAPAHAAGAVDVVLSAANTDTATVSGGYTYAAPVGLTSVTPSSGSTTGGDTVTIVGSAFSATPTVKFGDNVATTVTRIDANTLSVVVPATSVNYGLVNLSVTNNDGQTVTLYASFTYNLAAPSVSNVSPNSGPTTGGTAVTLTGSGFVAQQHYPSSLVAGSNHSCVISDGEVYCWGYNALGQTGNGNTTTPQLTPSKVQGALAGKTVTSLQAGYSHTCAIAAGELYCWGENDNGKIGNGLTTGNQLTPYKVQGLLAGKTVTAVAAGTGHTCAVAAGELYCWGRNSEGQIGIGSIATPQLSLVKVTGILAGKTATALSISPGGTHTCAVADSSLYCWGSNSYGETGNGNQTSPQTNPVAAISPIAAGGVTAVSAGSNHTCAVSNGTMYCMGRNSEAQAGTGGTSTAQVTPSAVVSPISGKTITAVSSGQYHTCAVANSALYCWGQNTSGQTGVGFTSTTVNTPTIVISPVAGKTPSIISAYGHTCTVANNGLYCWGSNLFGQTGNGNTTSPQLTPLAHSTYSSSVLPFALTIGGISATPAITSTTIGFTTPAHAGGLVDIGLTASGVTSLILTNAYTYVAPPQVSSITPSSGSTAGGDTVTITGQDFSASPTVMFGSTNASSVTRVNSTTLSVVVPAASLSGAVNVVVTNNDGQLATLTNGFTYLNPAPNVTSVTPASGPVTGGTSVTLGGTGFTALGAVPSSIYAMGNRTCAIVSSELYCWGNNSSGQLGDASSTNRNVPTKVQGLLAGKTVTNAAGKLDTHTCAVASAEVYCWGTNSFGELGDASTTVRNTPVKVQGLLVGKTATKVEIGDRDTCAVASAEVYCWGLNSAGQLGQGSTNGVANSSPVKVQGLLAGKTVTDIAMGHGQVCAIAASELYCWGLNDNGQVGIGSLTTPQTSPVKVQGLLAGKTVTAVSGGGNRYTCAIANNEVYCWGNNDSGQLGIGNATQNTSPVKVQGLLAGLTVGSISTSGNSTTCATANSEAYCWGFGSSGQLGNGSSGAGNTSNVPLKVTGVMAGKTVTTVTNGDTHSCALASSEMYCWGTSTMILGNATSTGTFLVPTAIPPYSAAAIPFTVTVGGTAATVTNTTATALTLTTPAHAAGLVDIGLTNAQTVPLTLTGAFTYAAPPQVTSVVPNFGSTAGGDTVTITGQDFSASPTVKFGATSATNVIRINSTTLTAVVPASVANGAVDVAVTNNDGQIGTLVGGFTYVYPAPTIVSVAPTNGSVAGGTSVTITGTNFFGSSAATQVRFGGVLATSVNIVNATTITAVTPVHAAGVVDILLTRQDTQTATLASSFTYNPSAYAITSTALRIAENEPGAITVEARDGAGNSIVSGSNITLQLSSTSGGGAFARNLTEDILSRWNYTSVVLPAGQSSVTFYYKDAIGGTPTVTVTGPNNVQTSQVETITSRYRLRVTGVSDPVGAGVPSSITVQAVDWAGAPLNDYTGTVHFSSGDGSANLPGNFAVTAPMRGIHTFTNGVTMHTQGEQCITVTDVGNPDITGSQCGITVGPPPAGTIGRLQIITQPQSFAADGQSSVITVQTQDVSGLPVAVSSDTTLYIYSTSSTHELSATGGAPWSGAVPFEVVIPAGSTAAHFYYRDATLGSATITVRDDAGTGTDFGWTNATQTITSGVGAPSQLQVSASSPAAAGDYTAVTATVQDGNGNPVTMTNNTDVTFTSISGTGLFSASQTGSNPFAQITATILPGSSQVTVYFADTLAGQSTLFASETNPVTPGSPWTPGEFELQIGAAAPNSINFTVVPSGLQTNARGQMTVEFRDIYGNVSPLPDAQTLDLSANSPTGGFSPTANGLLVPSIPVAAGATTASFYYVDTTPGSKQITATMGSLVRTQSVEVTAMPITHYVITPGPQSITAGQPSAAMTIQARDVNNNNTFTTADTVVDLTTTSDGEFSLSPTTWQSITSATIAAGQGSVTVYYRDTQAGMSTLTFTPAAQPSLFVTQTMTINPGALGRLAITGTTSLPAYDEAQLSVQFQDIYGNVILLTQNETIQLATDSSGGSFAAVGGGTAATSVQGLMGTSSVAFYYKDADVGTPQLTASLAGAGEATHDLTITTARIVAYAITSTPASIVAGQSSQAITVEARDSAGGIATASADTVLSLSSNSGTGSFSATSNFASTTGSVTLPLGASTVSFYYRDTTVGTPTVQALESGHAATQGEQIVAAAPAAAEFRTSSQAVVAFTASSPISVGLLDAFGNTTVAGAGLSVAMSTSSASGEFSLNGTSGWSHTLDVPYTTGAATTQVYYRDSVVGQPVLTADGSLGDATQSMDIVAGIPAKVVLSGATSQQTTDFGALQIQAQTEDNKPAAVFEDTVVNLSAPGQFSLTPNGAVITTVTIPAGQASVTVYYHNTLPGTDHLAIIASGLDASSMDINITLGDFYKLVYTAVPENVEVNTASSEFTVTAQDAYGNVTPVTGDTSAYLYTSSVGGGFAGVATGPWTDTSTTILAGGASATFYYQDSLTGSATIVASESTPLDNPDVGVVNASAVIPIIGQDIDQLVFTTNEQTITAGTVTSLITVEALTDTGSPAIQDGSKSIALSSTSDGDDKFTATADPEAVGFNSIAIPAGDNSVSFYYSDTESGDQTLRASLDGEQASQIVTVESAPPAQLAFTTVAQTKYQSQTSDQMRVGVQDEFGNEAELPEAATISLASTCPGGSFSETADPWTSITSIEAPAGTTELFFYYKNSNYGDCTLSASGGGLTDATQSYTILRVATRIVLAGLPESLIAGQQSDPIAVQLVDDAGNPAPAGQTITVYLRSTSSFGTFSPGSITFSPSQAMASFRHTDRQIGHTTITASDQASGLDPDTGLIDYTQGLDVTRGNSARLTLVPLNSTLNAGQLGHYVMQIQNEYGGNLVSSSDITANLSTTAVNANSRFRAVAAGPVISSVLLPAGTTSTDFYYSQEKVQASTISATDSTGQLSPGMANISFLPLGASRLQIISAPQVLQTNQTSAIITVQVQDVYGNGLPTPGNLNLYISTSSPTGTLSSQMLTLPAGQSDATFTYRDTVPGLPLLHVSDSPPGAATDVGLADAAQTITVQYGVPARLRFTGQPTSLDRGGTTEAVRVELENAYGGVVPALDDMPVYLTTSSLSGRFALAPNGPWNVSQLTIPANSTGATFYYQDDSEPGDVLLTGSDVATPPESPDTGLINATALMQVQSRPAEFVITSAPQSLPARHTSGAITIEGRNRYGYPATPAANTTVYLRSSSGAGEFSASGVGGWGIGNIQWPANTTGLTVYYHDATMGQATLTVSDTLPVTPDTGWINANQQIDIIQQTFDHFLVTNISTPQQQGSPSSVVVIAQDADDYTVDWYAGTINFSSSDSGAFLPASYTFNPDVDDGSHTFTNGVAFSQQGTFTVAVMDQDGKTGQQTDIVVQAPNANPVARLSFASPSPPLVIDKDTPSELITIQSQDVVGDPTNAGVGGMPLRLTSASSGGQFATSPNGPWSDTLIVSIPEGLSFANVYYRDSHGGSTQITATDWIDGADSLAITNATLAVQVNAFAIASSGTSSLRSQDPFGVLIPSPFLFAYNDQGQAAGVLNATFDARDLATDVPQAVNWSLILRSPAAIISQSTVSNAAQAIFGDHALTAHANDLPFTLTADATELGGTQTAQTTLDIPVSPWVAEVTGSILDGRINVSLKTVSADAAADPPKLSVQLLDATSHQVVDPAVRFDQASMQRTGTGTYTGIMAKELPADGSYVLAATLADNADDTLAADASSAITPAFTPVAPVPVAPVAAPGAPTTALPEVPVSPIVPVSPVSSPVVVEPPAQTAVSESELSSALPAFVTAFAKSKVAAVAFPNALYGILGILAAVLGLQMYLEIRRVYKLLAILKRGKETAEDKDRFLQLSAHHLRTPITILMSAAEVMDKLPGTNPADVAPLRQAAATLREQSEAILAKVTDNPHMSEILQPDVKHARLKALRSPVFWAPVVATAVLIVGANWLFVSVGDQSLHSWLLIEQIAVGLIVSGLVYSMLRGRIIKREQDRMLQTAVAERAQLDAVKNQFIQDAYQVLSANVIHLGQSVKALQANRLAHNVNDAIARLSSLLSKFEILAQVSTYKINATRFSLGTLVEDSITYEREAIAAKHLVINQQPMPEIINQDPRLLTFVMQSVLDNAVKYSPDTSAINLSFEHKGENIVISVKDNGPGINLSPQELFQPFAREGSALTYNTEGIGLSLYLDKLIMNSLGGSISAIGGRGGTNITLTFPSL